MEIKELSFDQPSSLPNTKVHIFTLPPPLSGTATADDNLVKQINFPPEFSNLTEAEQNGVREFFYEVRRGKQFPLVHGAFGDMVDCDGIAQERIFPPEGGNVIKIWGNSYYFKGWPEKEIVEGLGTAKTFLSQLPRKLIADSWLNLIFLALKAVFLKKKFIHDLHVLFKTVHGHTVLKMTLPPYNAVTKELKRAGDETIRKMLDRMGKKNDIPYSWAYQNLLYHREYQKSSPREIWEFLVCVMDFAWLFIEMDNAYRFRLQDVLPLLDRDAVKKDVIGEVRRLMEILINRENPAVGVSYKWRAIKKMVIPLLYVNKDLRNFAREFLLELDIDKIKMDEHDFYYSRRRHTYMFEGKPTHERLEEVYQIDKDKNHARLQLVELLNRTQCPTCKKPNEQKVLGVRVVQQI